LSVGLQQALIDQLATNLIAVLTAHWRRMAHTPPSR